MKGNEKLSNVPLVKGHNSRTVKVTPPKFNLDLYFVVITVCISFIVFE